MWPIVAASLAGDFIWSLTYTDILSGWTEGGAVWNKGAAGVLAATREVEERLPFALLGFDSDNGGEFLNHHLWAYMSGAKSSGGLYSFAALSLRRQRPCGAKELDLGASTPGVWPAGRPGVGGADQRALSGGVGAVAELLFALFETRNRSGARAVTGASAMSCPGPLTSGSAPRECWRSKSAEQLRERYESLDPFALKDELESKLEADSKTTNPTSNLDVIPPAPPKDKSQVFDRRGARARARSPPPCSF